MPLAPPVSTRRATIYTIKPTGYTTGAGPVQTTIRYVRKSGSDANGGTSPADAWLTFNKALTTAPIGSIVYVGAGVYREVVTTTITPTAGLPVTFIGDVDGLFTGDAGMVQWTAYTTSDKTIPVSTAVLNLSGKSYLNFMNIFFVGGNSDIVTSTTKTSTWIKFFNCGFLPYQNNTQKVLNVASAANMSLDWLFDRCVFIRAGTQTIVIQPDKPTNTDIDLRFVIQNSLFLGGSGNQTIHIQQGLTVNANRYGGVSIRNCTQIGAGIFLNIADASHSTSIPSTVYNCLIINSTSGSSITANVSGQIVEDYNLIGASSPRTNVTAGAHSISDGSYALLFYFGQERIWGDIPRPLGGPMASGPLSAFGAYSTATGSQDIRGGPRPGAASRWDVGAVQNGNNAGKETITINTGLNAISITGDGFQDFEVEVDAGPLTINVYCNYDGSYTGPLPRLAILANGEVGVGYTEVNFSGTSSGAFSSASITINPTASGYITVRVISGDTSGVSKVAFDTFSVA